MGSCLSSDKHNEQIGNYMKENEKMDKKLTKLLFLGPGGSGKSTIFKQLQWLHGDGTNGGYTKKDLILLQQQINDQIICQMKDAIKHYLLYLDTASPDDTNDNNDNDDININKHISIIMNYNASSLSPEITTSIKYIWNNDIRLKGIFKQHHTKKVLDETTEYFWNEIDRISSIEYIPNKTDIINLRNRTTGIIEKKFSIKNDSYHIFDVGGQKSERKKWIKCFDDVSALIFVVSLACYNENMYEDKNKNCMHDALELFNKTINNKHFDQKPIILFLNKTDLFEIKIKELPITACCVFDDYPPNDDPNDYDLTTRFIVDKFKTINNTEFDQTRDIFVHLTCAMDDKNVEDVFNDVTNILLNDIKRNLNNNHIL